MQLRHLLHLAVGFLLEGGWSELLDSQGAFPLS